MIAKYEKRLNKRLINLLMGGKKKNNKKTKKVKKIKKHKDDNTNPISNKVGLGSFVKDGVTQMKKDLKI